jgi:replicative DNA helicase
MWEMQRGKISDEQMRSFGRVVDEQDNLPLFIDDDSDSSLTNIRAKALRHQLEFGIDAVFVDYLQLIEPPARVNKSANRTEQVSAISRDLKRLARELKVLSSPAASCRGPPRIARRTFRSSLTCASQEPSSRTPMWC